MTDRAEIAPAKVRNFGFVVIGRNEGQRLTRCLASLSVTGAPISYADSASTDDSADVARTAGAIVVELDDSQPLNAARGRNAGLDALRLAHPRIEFVMFIDGDCELQTGWIEVAMRFFQDQPRTAVACGRRFEAYPNASVYNRIFDEEWDTPIGLAASCGGDALFRLQALDCSGPFDVTLMAGEEPELCNRLRELGHQIWRLDHPMTRHDAAMFRFSQWLRRARRSGFGYAQGWRRTEGRPDRLYGAQLRSALSWAAGLPAVIAISALLLKQPWVLIALPLIYTAQIGRIAMRRPIINAFAFKYAVLMVIAKFPEFVGAVEFTLRGERVGPIEYKKAKH